MDVVALVLEDVVDPWIEVVSMVVQEVVQVHMVLEVIAKEDQKSMKIMERECHLKNRE